MQPQLLGYAWRQAHCAMQWQHTPRMHCNLYQYPAIGIECDCSIVDDFALMYPIAGGSLCA